MSSQAFFWVNVGLGLILIAIFLFGKKGSVLPSRLNLRRQSSSSNASSVVTRSVEAADRRETQHRASKDLNVIFVYNGHNFDAYEVFGLPAGSSFESVQKTYQAAIQKNGCDQLFLEAAFRALQDTKK